MFFKYLWSIVQPKTADQAGAIKYRLALAYAFFGWSACSYFFYRVCSDRLPSDPDERSILFKFNDLYHRFKYFNVSVINT